MVVYKYIKTLIILLLNIFVLGVNFSFAQDVWLDNNNGIWEQSPNLNIQSTSPIINNQQNLNNLPIPIKRSPLPNVWYSPDEVGNLHNNGSWGNTNVGLAEVGGNWGRSVNNRVGNFDITGVPATVEGTIAWVISTGDNGGRAFLIADKRSGELVLVERNGVVIGRTPALFGKYKGDRLGLHFTPAGAFKIIKAIAEHPGYGGDVLTFANDDINKVTVSLHRVWLENPAERRLQRLQSSNPNERRISDGCINIPDSFYNNIVDIVNGSKIYILPETRATF